MSIGKVSEFDVKTGVWSSYIERLDMYFTANEVKSERKLPTLIAVMGDEAYELLVNLASPSKPSGLKYEEAIDLLAQHLQPAPSALAERYKYRQRRQRAEETIACYVAELKRLARYCKFGSNLSENLRDQFVCGLRSDTIRQRLFAEDDALTYNNAVKLATSLEAAERNAAVVDAAGTASIRGDSAAQFGDMHAMAVAGGGRRSDASGGSRCGKGGAQAQRGARGGALSAASTGGNMQGKRMFNGSMRACTGCGATNHGYETCRFREYECSRCRRKGHLRRVCPEQGAAGIADKKERTMYYANAEEPGVGQMTWEEEEDFHHLCLNDYRAVSLPISIENNTINMEVDTGTAVSCINSDTYKRFFRQLKLEKTSVRFKFYDGSVLKPLGIIKTKVKYAGVEKELDLFVIEGGTTSLLGRQWLSELNIKLPIFSSCNKVDSIQFNKEIQLLLTGIRSYSMEVWAGTQEARQHYGYGTERCRYSIARGRCRMRCATESTQSWNACCAMASSNLSTVQTGLLHWYR